MAMALPEWATEAGHNGRGTTMINVDTDAAYAAWLEELDVETPDQFWLETAYQCIKMDVQVACGFNVEIRMQDPDKNWAQSKHEVGRGADQALANRGREIRQHYTRVRGFLPAAQ